MLIDDVVNDPETAPIAVHSADQITDIMHLVNRTRGDTVDKVLNYVMRLEFWLQAVFFKLISDQPDRAGLIGHHATFIKWLKQNGVRIVTVKL